MLMRLQCIAGDIAVINIYSIYSVLHSSYDIKISVDFDFFNLKFLIGKYDQNEYIRIMDVLHDINEIALKSNNDTQYNDICIKDVKREDLNDNVAQVKESIIKSLENKIKNLDMEWK